MKVPPPGAVCRRVECKMNFRAKKFPYAFSSVGERIRGSQGVKFVHKRTKLENAEWMVIKYWIVP